MPWLPSPGMLDTDKNKKAPELAKKLTLLDGDADPVLLDVAVDLAALRERVLLIATLTFPSSIHSFNHFQDEKNSHCNRIFVTITA